MQDILYAFRTLLRTPVITAVAIISLALGIGANTAIFSVLNALVLRSLPVRDSQQLVSIYSISPENPESKELFSFAMFQEMQRQQRVFSTMFSWSGGSLSNLEVDGLKFVGVRSDVSGDYFNAMGVQPLLGRLIQPEDVPLNGKDPAAIAVLEYDCWQRLFQGDPRVIGKTIRLEANHPLTIVGVSRKGFSGLNIDSGADVTVPIGTGNLSDLRSRNTLSLQTYARLKPGVSLGQARAQMQTMWPAVQAATIPEGYTGARLQRFFDRKLEMESAARGLSNMRTRLSKNLTVLMALVGAVLLIACVNLANLMMARAEGRRHEMAVRAALGASAWRLIRQLLTESVMLALSGAAVGFMVAIWTSRVLLRTMWTGLGSLQLDAAPDFRVLLFTTAVAVLTGLLFGLAPAWRLAQTRPAGSLRQYSRSVRGAGIFGKVLVSVQVALSMVLVLAAALFVRSLANMQTMDPGFRRDHVLLMLLNYQAGRRTSTTAAYYHNLANQLMQLPGAISVSFSNVGPINNGEFKDPVIADGSTSSPEQAIRDIIGPGFFNMIGMQVLKGREFEWRDDDKAQKVAVISESLSKRLFPNTDPIGRRINLNPGVNQTSLLVVGVVNSASLWRIQSHQPMALYTALLQVGSAATTVGIRTAGNPLALAPVAPKIVEAMGVQHSLRTQTITERSDRMLVQERMTAWLSAFFGLLAMLLACTGLYGLMSYAVTRRTAEIGIRMALGAQRQTIMAMVLREVLLLVAIGIATGIPAALIVSKWIAALLFGLAPTDPETIALAAGILFAVALLAGYLPARHASRIDPMTALRSE